jgi:hypothetical protein
MKRLGEELPSLTFTAFMIGWVAWGVWFYGAWFNSFLGEMPQLLLLFGCCLFMISLPVFVGWLQHFRFRLWQYFVWITLLAAQLAWFTQNWDPFR